MKKIIIALLLSIPLTALAQKYEIPKDKLLTGNIKEQNNTLGKNETERLKNAKIVFTGLTAGDFDLIKVTPHNKDSTLTAEPTDADTIKTYIVLNAVDLDIRTFDIYYNGEKKGTVQFKKDENGGGGTDEDPPATDPDSFESYMGVLASANFIGNNKFLSNVTPIVNLGGIVPVTDIFNKRVAWEFDINPYIGGEIDTKDSVSFIPAMMLYGRAGFTFNNYFHLKAGKKLTITFMPFGFGLKFIPNLRDSSNTVIQHNIRYGIGLKFENTFLIAAQMSHGWHNLTSQSQKNFSTVFGADKTAITYITVSGQFAVPSKNGESTNYLFFEWRNLLSKQAYAAFSNNRILTIGVRKTISFSAGAFPANDLKRRATRKTVFGL
ncbi:MAG: hypothetical protein EOP46_15475 [Sphingobacteriaceae bacterium]|nr:MAG: hypothetical protein EOP46_15475 [Sphingobacteriaceae bacterium]